MLVFVVTEGVFIKSDSPIVSLKNVPKVDLLGCQGVESQEEGALLLNQLVILTQSKV